MYEIVDRGLKATVGMRLDGAVDQAEYAKMKLEYDPILDRAPRVNMVWQLGAGLTVEPSVMWDDMKLALSRADRLGRLALVAEDRWAAIVEIAVESGLQMRQFQPDQREAPWRWADEGD